MTAKSPDFGGYATKNDLLCSDGRTIKPGAFKHHDKQTVPLVWMHNHDDPENVLGHAVLEHREDGIYTYGYFNETPRGQHSKNLVKNGDVVALSIYANNLQEQSKQVFHGNIREVSLVLAGANPGALIDAVYIRHGDEVSPVEGDAIIYNDQPVELILEHADNTGENMATATDQKTVKDVVDSMSKEQQDVLFFLISEAVDAATDAADEDEGEDEGSSASHSDISIETITSNIASDIIKHMGDNNVGNVFETYGGSATGQGAGGTTLRHSSLTKDNVATIFKNAQKMGSFKDAVLQHAQTYGIENIDVLFPDAKALTNSPEIIGRRTEWVSAVINGTKHSPFSKIKSTAADLTADEARAKGYVKGALKKDEIIRLLRRVTGPTTIYKKQKLDRDDILDITDLNVVAWLKAEMRLMLEEELAGAILIGDGRASDDDDKIDDAAIRPIAYDADMYAHQVVVGSELTPEYTIEQILRSRTYYKGTGTPTLFTTDANLTDMLLVKDRNRRRIYNSVAELAAALRVRDIVTVEIMDRTPDVVAIIVNLADYTVGADQGGEVNLFDDFDIDYNQFKYLIETRVSGALTKPKSALVIKRTLGTVVSPVSPSWNGTTNTITFPATTGVVYSIDGATVSGSQVIEEPTDVEARPATGYSFPPNTVRDWTYLPTAG